jgi:plasmid maintenance system antidote protein VapI
MRSIEYFKLVKRRLGIESDYALAKALGLQSSAVSKIQAGKHTMGEETALKVAEILNVHPALVLADLQAEREKNPQIQAIWRGLAEKISMGFESLLSGAGPRGIRRSAC